MRFGLRKPSLKRSIKAMTTGRVKRAAKRAVNPLYGKRGIGFIRNPKKSAYNYAYKRTTFGGISGMRGATGCLLPILSAVVIVGCVLVWL